MIKLNTCINQNEKIVSNSTDISKKSDNLLKEENISRFKIAISKALKN